MHFTSFRERMFTETQFVLSLCACSIFRDTTSLLEFLNRVTNGELNIKIETASKECKALYDVMGCVKGFLSAQK